MLTRFVSIAGVLAFATLCGIQPLSAQDLRGFAGGGVMSDVNSERFPAFGGGVLVDLGQPWISAGGQGEAFVSWPYFGGRGAVFGQGNVIPKGPVRPFLLAGVGFGESSGPLFGGGVEIAPRTGRLGLRVAVEDYLARVGGFNCGALGYSAAQCAGFPHGGNEYTAHQVTLRVGLLFW
jgi:hypothetical protein